MLEIKLDACRGSFHLQVECRFDSPWTVIFGPSGSGKSTFLRLLAGLDRGCTDSGSQCRVVLDNLLLADSASAVWPKPGNRQTALVAQQPSLFPHLSVEANVAYGLASLDREHRTTRVEEMLQLAGAAHLVNPRPPHLSGGEAQRVALARSLAPHPRLLLLDEPFAALDGVASDALIDRLKHWLREHKVQTILATHDATDAFSTGAEVALLREGRLTGQGPVAQVLAAERERLVNRLESSRAVPEHT